MRRPASLALALALGAGLGGCTLITSLESLRDGAGSDAGDATAPDGGSDASSDVAADGGAEGSAARFCADASSALFLCADFEDMTLVPPFTSAPTSAGGVLALADGGFASSFGVLLEYPQNNAAANLVKDAIPATTAMGQVLDIRMRVRLEQLGAPTTLDLVWVEAFEGTQSLDVSVQGALRFDSKFPDGGASITGTGRSLTVGTWHELRWVLTPSGQQTGLSLTLDGTKGSDLVVPMRLVNAGPLRVRIGDVSVQSVSTAWRLRIDDVSIGR